MNTMYSAQTPSAWLKEVLKELTPSAQSLVLDTIKDLLERWQPANTLEMDLIEELSLHFYRKRKLYEEEQKLWHSQTEGNILEEQYRNFNLLIKYQREVGKNIKEIEDKLEKIKIQREKEVREVSSSNAEEIKELDFPHLDLRKYSRDDVIRLYNKRYITDEELAEYEAWVAAHKQSPP